MSRATRAPAVRAVALAGALGVLTAAGHAAGGGAAPDWSSVIVLSALTIPVFVVAGRRKLRPRTLIPVLAIAQLAWHEALMSLGHSPGLAMGSHPPGAADLMSSHDMSAMARMPVGQTDAEVVAFALDLDLRMLAGHALAGALCALVLCQADRALGLVLDVLLRPTALFAWAAADLSPRYQPVPVYVGAAPSRGARWSLPVRGPPAYPTC